MCVCVCLYGTTARLRPFYPGDDNDDDDVDDDGGDDADDADDCK